MEKQNQKVVYEIGDNDYGKFLDQRVTSIVIDEEGYAFGLWREKLVGSFSLGNGTWHVI